MLICAVAYALTWRRLFFEICMLPPDLYARGSSVIGMLEHRPTLVLLLVGILPLFVFRKRITWEAIDDSLKMRNFMWIIALVIGITFATSSYNYFYDSAFLLDRAVMLALLVLFWFHPAFLFPFVVVVMVFALQIHHPLPEAMWNWPDKRMPMHALFAFVWLIYLRIAVRTDARLPLALALVIAGATYAHAGLSKMAIGPELTTWLLENPTSNIFVSAHVQGNWLGQLSDESVVRVANFLRRIDVVSNGYTLFAEIGAAMMLLDRRVTRFFLVACILLHLGILATTGIFFWKWIVVDIAMIWYAGLLWTWSIGDLPTTRTIAAGLTALTIGLAFSHFATTGILFAWWDTRHSQHFVYEAETESGDVYTLDPRYFVPYDVMFVQGRFYYLLPWPVLPGTYGVTHRYEVFEALQKADLDDLPAIYEQYAIRFYNPRWRYTFGDFVQRYVRAAMRKDQKNVLPSWLSIPYHFQTTFPKDHYEGQSKIQTVRVYFEEHFFDGSEIHELRRTQVMIVPIEFGLDAWSG